MARRKFLNTIDVASQSLSSYGSNTWYFFQDFVSQYKGIITHLKLWTGSGATRYGFYRSDDNYACLENTAQTTVSGTTEIAINTAFSVENSEVIQVALQATVNNTLKYFANTENPWEYYYATTLPTVIGSSYGTENRMEAMETWGYPVPTVTSVNGGSDIADSDTAVPVVGEDLVDFDYSSTNPRVYLCPTSTFGSAVEQTVTNISDTVLEITVDGTGLTPGTVYLFVETGLNQFSTGTAVTLAGGAAIPTAGSTTWTNSTQTLSGSGVQIPVGDPVSLVNSTQTISASGSQIPVGSSVDLLNSVQTLTAEGVQIPVGVPVSLINSTQTISASGSQIPVGAPVILNNISQTIAAEGVQIPVGDPVSLINSTQTISASGSQIPVGGPVYLENGTQTISAEGVQIPAGDSVSLVNSVQTLTGSGVQIPAGLPTILENSPQTFLGTGEVILAVPTAGSTTWVNSSQTLTAEGVQIPVGDPVSLDNNVQTLTAEGVQIPVGEAVTLNNSPQIFSGTGEVVFPSAGVPTAGSTTWTNSTQTLSGSGVQIPVGDPVSLVNSNQTLSGSGVQIPVGESVMLMEDPQTIVAEGVQIPVGLSVLLMGSPQTFSGSGNSAPAIPTGLPVVLTNSVQTFSSTGCVLIDESEFHIQPRDFFRLVESSPYDVRSTSRFGQLQETAKDVFIKELYDFFDYSLSDGLYKISELPNIQKFAFSSSGSCGLETVVNAIISYGDTPDKFPMISITSSSLRERKMNIGTNFVSNVQYPARVVGSNSGPFDFSSLSSFNIEVETTPSPGVIQGSTILLDPSLFEYTSSVSVDEIISKVNRTQALYYTVSKTVDGYLALEAGGISSPYENNSITIVGGNTDLLNLLGFTVGQSDDYENSTNPLKNRYSLAADMVINIDVVSDSINTRLELADLVYSFFGYYLQKKLFQFYGRSYFERDIEDEWFHISLKNRFSWSAEINKPRQGGEQYEHIYAIRGSVPIYIEDFIDKVITATPVWVDKESTSISRASIGSDVTGDYFGRFYK